MAELGWHGQFNMSGDQILALTDLRVRLPCQMVFDHMANPPLPAGIRHPSHGIARGLIDKGRAWVKLSGAYSNSRIGPPFYPEATSLHGPSLRPLRSVSCGGGERLAASKPSRRSQAGRCHTVRPLVRMGAGRIDTALHFGEKPRSALRFRQVSLSRTVL